MLWKPSPNFNDRALPISMIVLHYTGMKDAASAIERMTSAEGGVSAHYCITEEGEIVQMVREEDRAKRLEVNGKKLCETYSDVRSRTRSWVNEKTGRFWRGLWDFMHKLYAWLDQNAPAGTREKVDTLAADDAFAEATDWPALMPNS